MACTARHVKLQAWPLQQQARLPAVVRPALISRPAQAARQKAGNARADLEALRAPGPAGEAPGPAPEVARLERAVAARQQKLGALQERINDIEDRIFAPLSAKVRSQAEPPAGNCRRLLCWWECYDF